MTTNNSQTGAIRSEFADDPEMSELVGMFVEELPDRVNSITQCWQEQQLSELESLAHQLKGASGGYGFSSLGEVAKELEASLKETHDADRIRSQVDLLVDMCNRVMM